MRFRNGSASLAQDVAIEPVVEERRPGVYRWIDVVEVPFVGRQLTVRVLIPIEQHQAQLLLREFRVDPCQRHRVKRQVPGGEPGVLPLVRHRDHVGAVHVEPVLIARLPVGVALHPALVQPPLDVVDVGLLGPQQPGRALANHLRGVGAERRRRQHGVVLVGLAQALAEGRVEARHRIVELIRRTRRQPQAHGRGLAGLDVEQRVRRRLGPLLGRIDGVTAPLHHVVIDAVLLVRGRIGLAPQPVAVGLVVGEQQLAGALTVEKALAQLRVPRGDDRTARVVQGFQLRARRAVVHAPGVAEPQVRQQVQRRRLRSAIDRAHPDEDVLGIDLGELDEDIEVAVLVEDPGVEQLVLHVVARTAAVLGDQLVVRKLRLRILVEHLRVRVRGRAVEIEVVLLDVLAVVALAVGEAEHPFLQDRVLAVPHRHRETKQHVLVAEAGDAVLAALVGARPRLVVRQIVPGFDAAIGIFANATPLAFAEVGAPLPPGDPLIPCFVEPLLFPGRFGHGREGKSHFRCRQIRTDRQSRRAFRSIGRARDGHSRKVATSVRSVDQDAQVAVAGAAIAGDHGDVGQAVAVEVFRPPPRYGKSGTAKDVEAAERTVSPD